MFSRILVPVDGSELSQNAVRWADRLAVSGAAELFLLTVVQPLAGLFAVRPTPALLTAAAKEEQREIKAVTTKLSNLAHELHGRGIAASRYVQLGVPALRIAGFIEEHDIDLVVMGTHGRGGVR